jgi:hypothetical protein
MRTSSPIPAARLSRRGVRRHVVAHGPQALEPIELAHAWQHHVDHDIAQVDEHPFGLALAFHPERHDARALGELHDLVGNGFHVPRGRATGNDQEVGDGGLAADVDLTHVLGFQLGDCVEHLLAQGGRGCCRFSAGCCGGFPDQVACHLGSSFAPAGLPCADSSIDLRSGVGSGLANQCRDRPADDAAQPAACRNPARRNVPPASEWVVVRSS